MTDYQNGLACPACWTGARLQIEVTAWADILPDGADVGGDLEWSDDDAARCSSCGWSGRVAELLTDDEESPDAAA